MKIRLVITGRDYHTAQALPRELTLPEMATVADALQTIAQHLPDGQRLPDSCLVAVAGQHLGTLRSHRSAVLRDGDELVLIAPVAGG